MSLHATNRTILSALASGLLLAVFAASDSAAAQVSGGAASTWSPLGEEERAALERMSTRAAGWLRARQRADGAFVGAVRSELCPVPLTAMALWALANTSDAAGEPTQLAAAFLLRHRQPDGGIYDPARGLAIYTSGVAAQALRAHSVGPAAEPLADVLQALELFVYRRPTPESFVDLRDGTGTAAVDLSGAAEALLRTAELSAAERNALEFLSRNRGTFGGRAPLRTRVPRGAGEAQPSFGYDDLLQFAYAPVDREQQIARRALEAIERYYAIDRNPDLTRRYGAAGFQQDERGLYYYYFVLARALATFESPSVRLAGGESRDWIRELIGALAQRQQLLGHWVNADAGWWEDEPVLVTSYALLTLDLCRRVAAAAEAR